MTADLTTLDAILETLAGMPQTNALVFETDTGEIGGGYHVTELKSVSIKSIDCGGDLHDWQETHVQLLDGEIGDHMNIGKFSGIARKSIANLPALGHAPLIFEFATKNAGLRRYKSTSLHTKGTNIHVLLSEEHATCKPAVAYMAAQPEKSTNVGCCGSEELPAKCCA